MLMLNFNFQELQLAFDGLGEIYNYIIINMNGKLIALNLALVFVYIFTSTFKILSVYLVFTSYIFKAKLSCC